MTTSGNPYQSPATKDVRDEASADLEGALARAAMVVATFFAILVLSARGGLRGRFEDFDLDLPALTQLVLSPAFAFAVIALPALTTLNQRMLRCRTLRVSLHAFTIALAVALAALCAVGLYLPTVQIGESLD